MAGFSFNDINSVSGEEEAILKQFIADAWSTMKRTNWDDTKYCTINPKFVVNYPVARNFKAFFENEGWKVQLKKEKRNYIFDVYKSFEE